MEYWTIIDDRHAGPFSAEDLIAKGVGLDTPVWISGLPDWVEAREIPELRLLIEAQKEVSPAGNPPATVTESAATECAAETQEAQPAAKEAEAPAQQLSDNAPEKECANRPGMNGNMQPPQPPFPPQGNFPPAGQGQPSTAPGAPIAGQSYPPHGQSPFGNPNPWRPTPPGPPPQPFSPQPAHVQPRWEWQQEAKPIPEGAEIPPAYLAWAIVSTVLCCIPLGVPAIVFSTKTRQAIKMGDLEKAKKMSERTQWFIIGAIVLGLISMPLQIVFSGFQ